ATNDQRNIQNTTLNGITGDSLAITKFDHNNPVYTGTLGGPVLRDRFWFFGAYEQAKDTSAQLQTLVTNENYQQTTVAKLPLIRVSGQITPSQSAWAKYQKDPINGFIVDY